MIRKKILLYIVLLLSYVYPSIDTLTVYDSVTFNNMVYLKIASFDTIPGFINYHNRTSQYEYSQIFCTNLKNGFNAKTAYEILDADSRITPQVNLYITFKDLYTDAKELKKRRYYYTSSTIEIVGKRAQDNTPVFSAISRRKSRSDDLEDELRDNIIEIARDTYNHFEDLRSGMVKKSFQYYDFRCDDFFWMHYTFTQVPNARAIKLLYDVADAEIQNEIMDHDFHLERFYFKKTDTVLTDESIDFSARKNVISQNLRKYLLGRKVTSLLIIHSLNCDLPYDEMKFSRERASKFIFTFHGIGQPHGAGFGIGPASILSSFIPSNINDVDNAFCKLFLLDVRQNKCLISTQIYGSDGEDIADNILEAVGYFDEKEVEIESCFEDD